MAESVTEERETRSIQWKGGNIIDIFAFMQPDTPQYMTGFSDADRIVGVWTADGLKVARLGDWITRLPDGSLRVEAYGLMKGTQMAELDLEAIRERERKATPGPWSWSQSYELGDEVHWCLENPEGAASGKTIDASLVLDLDRSEWLHEPADRRANWEFIAHAREDIPALIAEVTRLKGELEQLRYHASTDCDAITRVWQALGVTDYTRKHIAEHVSELRAQLAEAQARVADLEQQVVNYGMRKLR